MFGEFNVTLTTDQLPAHTHEMDILLPNGAEVVAPGNNAAIGTVENGTFTLYTQPGGPAAAMNPMMLQPAGSSLPHYNRQPYLGLNYSIALEGAFPSFS